MKSNWTKEAQDKKDAIRILFEEWCNKSYVKEKVSFHKNLGTMNINDVFSHYLDSDVDSAFIGFYAGYHIGNKNVKDSSEIE